MKNWKSIILYIFITVVLAYSLSIDYSQRKAMEEDLVNTQGSPPAVGSQVPDFDIIDKEGNRITSRDLIDKYYLVVFWSSNCSYSLEMLNNLETYNNSQEKIYIEMLPININDSIKEIEKVFSQQDISLPMLVDYKKSSKWAFKVATLPAVYLVDPEGIILYRQSGYSEKIFNGIKEKISSVL